MSLGKYLAVALLLSPTLAAAGFDVKSEPLRVHIRVDWNSYEIYGRLFRPAAEGRRPLAVLAHGTCGKRCRQKGARYMSAAAQVFARSGYAAYVFERLGYGRSEGYLGRPSRPHEGHGGCNTQDYERAGRLVANQIRLVIPEVVKESPFIDPDRIVVMGHSGGGLGAVALTEKKAPGLLGVISAAGARGGACAKGEYLGGHFYNQNMIAAYRTFAKGSTTPVLMVFAENDPRTARAGSWRDAYADAGGSVKLVVLPPQRGSGHSLSRWNAADWSPPVSGFLKDLGLPTLEE